ncbi:MAG: hypothetical protein E4H14_07765 [Candidatus Thorarchaeota archaeon]|nr:MAG: hypothetical protein E4H14_07765 [Candidatus Thorarchaeota archaeon]
MSDNIELLKTRFFIIAALAIPAAGVMWIIVSSGDSFFAVMGILMIISGVFLLVTGATTPAVSQSKTGMIFGLVLLSGAILSILGAFSMYGPDELSSMLLFGGLVITFLPCLVWPCICCQSSKALRTQIIGVASSHDSITITELSNISGASIKNTSEIIYDAIGKRELSGRMEGATFIRAAPSTTTYSTPTTTREREIVKVLVICPYCGAKTEQGIGKCQNCQADL